MIWLASFPRSGNTFFRIVLYEVYGIESSEFRQDPNNPPEPDYDKYPVVKTHVLPHQLIPNDPDIPAVYLVRDGRDALVSIAHQKKDLIDPETAFIENLREAILAPGGSFFGGWSQNVMQWLERALIVIRFEDLIVNPIECVERLRSIIDLPEPKAEKLPTFEDLRTKDTALHRRFHPNTSLEERERWWKKFFRRGKVGAWKDEMPDEFHRLFWKLHGDAMEKLGYPIEDNIEISFQYSNSRVYMHRALRFLGSAAKTIKHVYTKSSD
jgi:hypothetical protein